MCGIMGLAQGVGCLDGKGRKAVYLFRLVAGWTLTVGCSVSIIDSIWTRRNQRLHVLDAGFAV